MIQDIQFLNMKQGQFYNEGFLKLDNIVGGAELTWLRRAYDAVLQHQIHVSPEEIYRLNTAKLEQMEVVGGSVDKSLITLVAPEAIMPALKETQLLADACRIVRCLLNVNEDGFRSGWRFFCKPPLGLETSWHQDAVYRPLPHRSVSIWIPLDDATCETSYMCYIPSSHRSGLLTHHCHGDHRVLEVPQSTDVVECELSAGQASIHHCFTVHRTTQNMSVLPRRAITLVFQLNQPQEGVFHVN